MREGTEPVASDGGPIVDAPHYPASDEHGDWAWRGARSARAFEAFDLQPLADVPFDARLRRFRCGRVTVSRFATSPQRARWSRGGGEDGVLAVNFLMSGGIRVQSGSGERTVGPGTYALVRPEHEWTYRTDTGCQFVSVMVRPGAATPVLSCLAHPLIVSGDERTAAGLALGVLLRSLVGDPAPLPGGPGGHVESGLAALVTAVAMESAPRAGLDADERTWWLANAEIDRALADPALSPTSVAAVVGVPLRRLQYVFAEHGATIAAHIRRRRVTTAAEMLQRDRTRRVADVARLVGFASSDQFDRAHRAEFGVSPTRRQGGVEQA